MAPQGRSSEFAFNEAVVLSPDVNSVILENLTALVGPRTAAMLDAMANDAVGSRTGPKVN